MSYQIVKISDFCLVTDFVANGSFEALRNNVEYLDGDGYAILVRLTDFTKKWKADFKYVSESAYKFLKHSYLLPNDLLMSNVGEPGKVFLVPDLGKPMTLGPNSILIRPDSSKAIQKFIHYFFMSPIGFEKIRLITSGTTQKKFNKTSFRALEINLPPLATQQKIVAKLDAIFAEIDKATAAAEANAKNAEALFQSFLRKTFSNSKKQSNQIRLENISTITSSKRIMKHEYVDNGIPFYRTKEVKELANKRAITTELYISKENYYEIKSKFGAPQKGELLITAIGTIGEIYVVDTDDEFYFKDGNVLWVKDLKDVEPEFLKYVLVSFVNELNEMSLGAAYSALPIHKLKNYEVFIPNLEQQKSIVLAIRNIENYSKTLVQEYFNKKYSYTLLKQAILTQAFNGELVKE